MALLPFLAFLGVDSVIGSVKRKNMRDQAIAQGAFLPYDLNKHHMIWQDVYRDWDGEKKLFPTEYHAYFARNKEALEKYMVGLVSIQEIAEGRKPVLCVGTYNKFTFSPFHGFHYLYDEKIKIFNETGVFYY